MREKVRHKKNESKDHDANPVRTRFDTPSNVSQPLVGEAHGDEVPVGELVDHEGVVRKLETLRERD